VSGQGFVTPGFAAPAIALVQHAKRDTGNSSSTTLAFAASNTAGNWIGVVIRGGASGLTFSVSDTNGNLYKQAVKLNITVDTPLGDTLAIWYAENIRGGANTVTVTQSSGVTLRLAVLEFAGVAPTNSLDVTTAAQGTSTTSSSGTVTPSVAGALILGGVATADGRAITAGAAFTGQDWVPGTSNAKLLVETQVQTGATAVAATASFTPTNPWGAVVAAFRPAPSSPPPAELPDLTVAKSHSGNFTQGQVGATYTLTVTNTGPGATSGTVTLTETPPSALTVTAMTGTGWSCAQPAGPCTRSNAVASGASYPPVTVTVNVSATAPGGVTNAANVSGGGETNTANNTASDPTTVVVVLPPPDLRILKTHSGHFSEGQTGATYSIATSNIGGSPTNGLVTVTDTVPAGLTATSIAGTGWSCAQPAGPCTRNDALAAGASYPALTLTVSVSSSAPASVTNTASVAGGGDVSPLNNVATDPTAIDQAGGDQQPPSAPTVLTATTSGNRVNLTWKPSTDNVGVTSYLVEECQGAGCANFTELGSAPATGAPPLSAPLTVSSNPNYFKDGAGRPIVLNGSHTWNTFQDWGTNDTINPVNFDEFVNFLVSHGHNFTLLWQTELPRFCNLPTTATLPPDFVVGPLPWQRTGPGLASDGGLQFDLTKFDQSYFDRLRSRVQALNAAGIYAGVYFFTGEWLNVFRCGADGYPFTGGNNVNGVDAGSEIGALTMTAPNAITDFQDAFVKKTIDTLNDLPNVLWIVSEEAPPGTAWWNDHHIAHARAYEATKPFQHPIGYGVWNHAGADDVLINSAADWISPFVRISPTSTCGSGTPPCKVVINDSDHSYWEMWNDSAQTNRNYAWENFMNGNQVVFMDPYKIFYPRLDRNLCPSPVNGICSAPDPRWDNFRDTLGAIGRYGRRLNLAAALPSPGLCSTGSCLAQTPAAGAEYLVYAPEGGTFTVNLSAMSSARTLNVEWFNPATGVTTIGNPIAAGSVARSFSPPFSGDAVLYLVDAAGHAGPLDNDPTYSVSLSLPGDYSYRVRAVDEAGNLSPYSTTVSVSVLTSIAPATNLVATAVSTSQVNLNWTASGSAGVTGYQIERCGGPGCANFVDAGTTTGTTFSDTGLASSTSYTYRVEAMDGIGNVSGYSNNATALTLSPPPSGPIALVQHRSRDGGSTTVSTLAFASANTAGNFIGVVIRGGASGLTFSVSDTNGNLYKQAVKLNITVDTPLGDTLAIWYAENIRGGANTVTVTQNSSVTVRFAVLEYAGVAGANALDITAAAQGTSTTPSSGSVTPTSAGSLVLGAIATADNRSIAAGTGFTGQDWVPASSNAKLLVEDRVLSTAQSLAATASFAGTNPWGAVVAVFRPAPR
jgi:uncharacterized repeat protein (TIGR01451 family)